MIKEGCLANIAEKYRNLNYFVNYLSVAMAAFIRVTSLV
jgi:hypothetical protein